VETSGPYGATLAGVSSVPASSPVRAALVVLAAGAGRRAGHETNKVLLPLAGRPVFTWSTRRARELAEVCRTLLVIREQDRESVQATLQREPPPPDVEVVAGRDSRHGSEWAALQVLASAIDDGEIDVVVIHDAARPLADPELFAAVIESAVEHGGAVPAVPLTHLVDTEGRPVPHGLVGVQTPQAFRATELLAAYRAADADGFEGTDTAACVERYADVRISAVSSTSANVKITFPEDIALANALR
jgi:2-C-methyl-D-erythritol 4-phosphate cytidylyltransferase